MSVCFKCSGNITKERFPGVKCSGMCEKLFHVKCACISDELLRGIKSRSANWLCEVCREAASQSIIDSDMSEHESDVNLTDIMKQLKKMEYKLSALEDLKISISTIQSENIALRTKLNKLEQQLAIHNTKLHLMEAENDKPYQMQNISNITISGLPLNHGDIRGMIVNTIGIIEPSIQRDDIVSIDEVHKNNNTSSTNKLNTKSISHGFFIVKLKSSDMKNNVLTQMRKKKSLYTKELTVSLPQNHPEQRIHIMHHLTRFQSQLYREAKNIKIKYNYKFLWCKSGQIYLRKSTESDIQRIHSLNDIFRLSCNDHQKEDNTITGSSTAGVS